MAHKYIVIVKLFHFSNAWDQHEFTNKVNIYFKKTFLIANMTSNCVIIHITT